MGSGGWPNGSRASVCTGRWGYGLRLDERSRMSRAVHVRICEGAGVRFPRATRRIIPGSSAALLATEVRPLVEQCLRERGLTLAPAKTTLTPIADGCDFLGHTMRQ
jgi:hypothetical protein